MFKLSVAAIGVIAALAGTTKAENTTQMIRNGAQAYQLCAGCHSLKFGVHLTGPSLANLWGMRAASISDYVRYTAALKKSDFIWDEITLNAWLANPQLMVPGTAMTFRGIEKDETRDNLIAFLRLALAPDGMAKVVKDGLIPERMAVGQIPPALATVDANQRIKQIRHCRDAYYVTTADGVEFPFWETNVRLKTDTGARGPKTGEPVLLRSGMAGDRVSIVFSNLSEINRLVVEKC